MKRYDFESALYASGLDARSKQLLSYYAFKKNWNNNTEIWVSAPTTARETGLSLTTVNRRNPSLRDSGWLVDTGKRVGNGAIVYDLAIGSTPVCETVVTDTTENNPCLSDSTTPVSESRTPVSETLTPVCETDKQVNNKIKEQVREQVKESPVSDEPVASPKLEDELLGEVEETLEASETLPPSLNSKEQDPETLEGTNMPIIPNRKDVAGIRAAVVRAARGFGESADTDFWNRVRELATDEDFKPEVTKAEQRVGHAQSAAATELARAGNDW